MREAFCKIVGLDLQAAETLIKSPGFTFDFWVKTDSQGRRQITIIDDDPWFEESGRA
jgi:hypothetical protein